MMTSEFNDNEEDPGNQVAQQLSHFEHAAEFQLLLAQLLDEQSGNYDKSYTRIQQILDTYQEQPHLLDPHLESMITPVVIRIRANISSTTSAMEAQSKCAWLFRYLYYLTKARGYKTIVKFMTHEVSDLEPMVDFMNAQEIRESACWETRYVCLIWLSIICMVPFDLRKIDSGLVASGQQSLINRLLDIHKRYLGCTGKERDASSILVARLLSRRDVSSEHLIPYLEWAKEELSSTQDVFKVTGFLSSLCAIFQYAARDILLPALDDVAFPILSLPFINNFSGNSVIRKLYIKLSERISLCYLRPRVARWRYQRGNRSLANNLSTTASTNTALKGNVYTRAEDAEEENDDIPEQIETVLDILLNGLRDKDTIVRWSAAKGVGRICQRLPQEFADDVVGSLLELFTEDVLKDENGSLDISATSEHTWHGACLSIAELSRRGLLLPERLNDTVDWIALALKFDLKRGSHSIGSNVRDAACYVCWSFARAYAPEVIQSYVAQVANSLVCVSVYDREINVRRAASAAFQENVGRQGVFPNGIDIIQAANYYSLGNRNQAFLEISVEIAQFDLYRGPLIDHLIKISIRHWDKQIRTLSSQTLHKLVPIAPRHFIDVVLPQLIPDTTSLDQNISHGALLSVAEISLALTECSAQDSSISDIWQHSSKDLRQRISTIVRSIPEKNLTTFGSEHIREAACHLIACLAEAGILTTEEADTSAWDHLISTSLKRKEENVQKSAVAAFGSLARYKGIDELMVKECIEQTITTRHLYGRRGYALALGAIPFDIPRNDVYLPAVLSAIISAMSIKDSQQENDAETKRNGVLALQSIIQQLHTRIKEAISYENFQNLVQGLLKNLEDYSIDQRGDVGSWVREESMKTLSLVVPLVTRMDMEIPGEHNYLGFDSQLKIIAKLLKQAAERIDRTRACAGNALSVIVNSTTVDGRPSLHVPGQEELLKIANRELDWTSPADVYPLLVPLLAISAYRSELLIGLITSAGSRTESLLRHSSQCLSEYINQLPTKEGDVTLCLQDIVREFNWVLETYRHDDRVSIALLEVVGSLFESGTLSHVNDDQLYNRLLFLTRKEAYKSRDVRKLVAVIRVLVGYAGLPHSKARTTAIQQLLTYLVHPFPKVRVATADQLFIYLSTLDDQYLDDRTMEAEEIITSTDWMKPVTEIKELRDQLYDLMDVQRTT
ncbi:armadillo-type protein [Umbelopsis sp. PMI_123]|nr:armadillo-type protein [Umbelopsis sp. PMI_123]